MARILLKDGRVGRQFLPKTAKQGFVVAFVLAAIQWWVCVWYLRQLPPEVPLWYSLPYGNDWLAAKESLVLLPVLGTGFTSLNLLITWWWKSLDVSVTMMLAWTSALIAGLTLIALSHILLLVL
jgi:hypothetical protein